MASSPATSPSTAFFATPESEDNSRSGERALAERLDCRRALSASSLERRVTELSRYFERASETANLQIQRADILEKRLADLHGDVTGRLRGQQSDFEVRLKRVSSSSTMATEAIEKSLAQQSGRLRDCEDLVQRYSKNEEAICQGIVDLNVRLVMLEKAPASSMPKRPIESQEHHAPSSSSGSGTWRGMELRLKILEDQHLDIAAQLAKKASVEQVLASSAKYGELEVQWEKLARLTRETVSELDVKLAAKRDLLEKQLQRQQAEFTRETLSELDAKLAGKLELLDKQLERQQAEFTRETLSQLDAKLAGKLDLLENQLERLQDSQREMSDRIPAAGQVDTEFVEPCLLPFHALGAGECNGDLGGTVGSSSADGVGLLSERLHQCESKVDKVTADLGQLTADVKTFPNFRKIMASIQDLGQKLAQQESCVDRLCCAQQNHAGVASGHARTIPQMQKDLSQVPHLRHDVPSVAGCTRAGWEVSQRLEAHCSWLEAVAGH